MTNESIELIIKELPVAKGRPRVSTKNGFARAYNPKKTRDYESKVKMYFKAQFPKHTPFTADDVLKVVMEFYYPIPKSYSKKKREQIIAGGMYKNNGEDLDNLEKAVLDALNGIAYCDDRIISEVEKRKYWTLHSEGYSRVEIRKI